MDFDFYIEEDEHGDYDQDYEDYEADEAEEDANSGDGDRASAADGTSPDTDDKPNIEEEHPRTKPSEKAPSSGANRPGLTPPPEHGIHAWTMTVAWECKRAGYTPEEAIEKIMAFNGTMRRYFQPREVEDAVEKAFRTSVDDLPGGRRKSLPEWNPAETERLAEEHPLSLDELVKRSGAIPSQIEILRSLFPAPDSLVCIGRSKENFRTDILDGHMNLESAQLIVPAIMTKRLGVTDEGKLSAHSKDNTGPRKYIVFDFDKPPAEEQLAVISFFFQYRTPVLVMHSGGKSFHAWFHVSEDPELDEDFWKLGICLGADPAIYRGRSSFVRLPMGRRDNGALQQVHYFNPNATAENLGDIKAYLLSLDGRKGDSTEAKDEAKDKPKDKPKSDIKFYTVEDFNEIEEGDHLVADLLTVGGTSVIYGASGSRKTFWAMDLAAHIASGKPWRGRNVMKGAVIYVSLEGKAGFKKRLKALKSRGILSPGAPFHVTFDYVQLPRDADRLVEAVMKICAKHGITPVLVVIDTLARCMAGGDENSGRDMAEIIAAMDRIRDLTGAHVGVVHHAGKDEGRGARGHSSLRAAMDTEIRIAKHGDYSAAEVKKQRDLEEGEVLPFSIEAVVVGLNKDGKEITSAVVIQQDELPASRDGGGTEAVPATSLLDLLPVESVEEWVKKAKESLGIARGKFFELKKALQGVGFKKCGKVYMRSAE